MYDLTVIKQNGGCYIDSRDVAELISKEHNHLLRDIRGYVKVITENGASKNGHSVFFVESSYQSAQNKSMPCYLLSKMGCEMVANKLTGEKGILFTAAYVTKFNEMEIAERNAQRAPRLGEYNAAARLIVCALRNMGASAERILLFLKSVYEPLGIVVDTDDLISAPQTYTAKQIAEMLHIYSLTGKPHARAVSAILNEHILIGDEHKTPVGIHYLNHNVISVRYDEYAAQAVYDWLIENNQPDVIYGAKHTYKVRYASE